MLTCVRKFVLPFLCLASVCLVVPRQTFAQFISANPPALSSAPAASVSPAENNPDPSAGSRDSSKENSDSFTLFPHSQTSRYWISGQANIVLQWHGAFPAAYSGPHSLHPYAENATSKVYTLFLGYELTSTTEVLLDIESAGGHGISDAQGLAGFTNLDVVRNPELGDVPYIARIMIRQIIPLSSERVEAERGPFGFATSLPARRIELRFGKFGMVDFFDLNTYGSDSHLQFLNWTVDNNGAYDYAANTRGYTDGVILEYDDHWFTARFAETLMPKVANGINLDADIARARAANLEFDAQGKALLHRAGAVRLLAYLNHANMGNYRQAIDEYLDGQTSTPDITATRRQGRHKYGFGLNFEQSLFGPVSAFGRLGWSDGRNESFAYTEVDRALELGGFATGGSWKRKNDRAGAVFAMNGIVAAHQQYLALGGLGFLLGDGGLTYGHEKIFEGFYTAHLWRGFFASFDLQHVNNPGYNKARGPVTVPGLRFHVEF
ncbi:MAG TPA: carbohydrate porin [Candidatus Acidoferrum sp.]|nr:carbohydrate porin [Candidatus Acidoferrum sp.]